MAPILKDIKLVWNLQISVPTVQQATIATMELLISKMCVTQDTIAFLVRMKQNKQVWNVLWVITVLLEQLYLQPVLMVNTRFLEQRVKMTALIV